MKRRRSGPQLPSLAIASCSVLALILLSACGGSQTSSDDERFWSALRLDGEEAEQFSSLVEMTGSADAVVLGRIASFEVSRTLQGDASEDVVVYAKADLKVTETLAGLSYGDVVPLEFLLPVQPEAAEAAMADLQASVPSGELVVFLRAKPGEGEGGLFRVVNSTGLWAETSRSSLDTPLTQQPASESGIYASELRGVSSISELAAFVRQASLG